MSGGSSWRYHYFLISILCVFCVGCHRRARIIKKNILVSYNSPTRRSIQKKMSNTEKPVITVWIHGTKFMRSDTYKKVFNGTPDIKHIKDFPSAHKIQFHMQLLNRDAPELFDYNSLYIFGWSGRLSTQERYWAALILYQKLSVLRNVYMQRFGIEPIIRLVTHSHGGNIALNLARIHNLRKDSMDIDTLVLLACPVQHETKELVTSGLFKQIYAIYSSLDMIQVLAPEFMHRMRDDDGSIIGSCLRLIPFSQRCFDAHMPVKQAWIKINGHAIAHSSFTTTKFLRTLPKILKTLDELYEEHESVLETGEKEILLHIHSRCVPCR